MHQGTWRWMRVHSSTGSGEHCCTLTQCSWDSGPRCSASWEGCDATVGREREREREGLFLRMTVCVCVCVLGPRRVSVNARLCFLKVPWQHKCVHQYACTDICKYTQPSSCVHAGISVLTFLPKVFLSMYSLYCYHVCPQPPQFRLFSGKLPHKQKCCSSDIWFLFFFCGCPGESSVMLKHLEVLLKVWVTACWVRPAFVQMKCEPIRGSYNTSPTDLVKRVSSSHSRWFTGFIVTDDMEMNHARAPLSDDFLFWLRVPLGSPTHPPSYRSCAFTVNGASWPYSSSPDSFAASSYATITFFAC